MDIKRIPGLQQPFQANAATEASDEERRREKQESKKKVAKTSPAIPDSNEAKNTEAGPENNELCRQIVDSEKVLQLLEQRPQSVRQSQQKLQRIQSSQTLSAQQKQVKHVNRSL